MNQRHRPQARFAPCDHTVVTPGCEDCDNYQREQEAAWNGYARIDRKPTPRGNAQDGERA